jgi:hypothetical protein
MDRGTAMRLTMPLLLSAAVSLLVPATGRADPPGYDFMSFPERMALVVSPSTIGTSGKAPKAVISDAAAAALVNGAEPVSGTNILLLYQGKIYIVPDKRLGNGTMASDMITSAAEHGK